MKEETLDCATKMTPAAEQPTPVKAPFFHMKRMTSFLRKGRAKDYLVHVPSPPPLDLKPPLLRAANPTTCKNKVQTGHASDVGHTMGRLLAVHPDSSRVVELQRPPAGFHGLYLAKKSQNHDAGLYVVQLGSVFTSTYPQGVLKVGDEILEINKRRANDLSVEEINALFEESRCVLLHVLPTAVSSRSPVQNVKSVPNARYV
ncbi:uncharacterized protein LOC128503277 [Spea bombifrons]|uniref:uncharacterized protein LOC128503277 n=1 Tax=Spea bombifrons TaxID=233779 RepID=UPI00234974FA|nr:uncharacterized protein LOC128503277 [Spea bombifrons]